MFTDHRNAEALAKCLFESIEPEPHRLARCIPVTPLEILMTCPKIQSHRVPDCAAWFTWSPWRRQDHETTAIYDCGGVVRNRRSRGLGGHEVSWLRYGQHRE